MQVNLKAVWQLSQAAGRHFLEHKKPGKIISTASLMSFQGGIQTTAYAASKGGLATMTKALANEWASHGICVNAIVPGYVVTDLTAPLKASEREPSITCRIPCGYWATPDDFKGPVVFLASRASNYVHGELLLVDGGWMGKRKTNYSSLGYGTGVIKHLYFVCRPISRSPLSLSIHSNTDIDTYLRTLSTHFLYMIV